VRYTGGGSKGGSKSTWSIAKNPSLPGDAKINGVALPVKKRTARTRAAAQRGKKVPSYGRVRKEGKKGPIFQVLSLLERQEGKNSTGTSKKQRGEEKNAAQCRLMKEKRRSL